MVMVHLRLAAQLPKLHPVAANSRYYFTEFRIDSICTDFIAPDFPSYWCSGCDSVCKGQTQDYVRVCGWRHAVSLSLLHHYPPPTSPWWGALKAKVQELAAAPAQTTDQWARSLIDRATWAPEVLANPCNLSAALAAGICWYRPLFSRQACAHGDILSHTHTHRRTGFTPNPLVTYSCPHFSHHPPLSPWTWRQLH